MEKHSYTGKTKEEAIQKAKEELQEVEENLFIKEIEVTQGGLFKKGKVEIEELIIEDDDWKNDIPLDELISSADETNDCVQFSLFGDNQTINE